MTERSMTDNTLTETSLTEDHPAGQPLPEDLLAGQPLPEDLLTDCPLPEDLLAGQPLPENRQGEDSKSENEAPAPFQNELELVVEAGKIMMESGAEIYRIKETMSHMADSLQIDSFDAFVINRGIFASGKNRDGHTEAKITNVPDAALHLGRIEAINSLSREISLQRDPDPSLRETTARLQDTRGNSLEEIAARLQDIRKETPTPLWLFLLAYFTVTGSFSFAIGSTAEDALGSAICGLVLGLTVYMIKKHVSASVLRTIIGSAVVTVSANLLYLAGLGQHRGLMILGAFVVIVPGATFTNSVRELAQNNYSTCLTLLMSATLSSLAMTAGVLTATAFLPFVDQMTDTFSAGITSPANILIRALMAGLGTVAFAVIFHAPRKYYPDQGIMGSVSWMILQLSGILLRKSAASIFIAALTAALLARLMAVRRSCPSTIFLSVCIFPLMPGLSFYRGVYFLLTGEQQLGWAFMRACFVTVFAIAIAITIAQQIPEWIFAGSKQ